MITKESAIKRKFPKKTHEDPAGDVKIPLKISNTDDFDPA